MKKVYSDFMDRLDKCEIFWVALPSKIIKHLPIGLLAEIMSAGGIAELSLIELEKFNKKFRSEDDEKA